MWYNNKILFIILFFKFKILLFLLFAFLLCLIVIIVIINATKLQSAIVVLFLGCWSDATGRRKFLMWLPCLGNALYALFFLLPLYVANEGDINSPITKARAS